MKRNGTLEPQPLLDHCLIVATREGHLDEMRTLIEKGANMNIRDRYGRTPLMIAALNGHEETVRILLERNADVDARSARNSADARFQPAGFLQSNPEGFSAVRYAVMGGHQEIVKLLLDHIARKAPAA